MSISDANARRVGVVTVCTVCGAVIVGLAGLLAHTELESLGDGRVFFGVLLMSAVTAWSVAHFVMLWHQDQGSDATAEEIEEWKRREDSRLGFLVPFTYLLASPEQRRVLRYLKSRRRDEGAQQ